MDVESRGLLMKVIGAMGWLAHFVSSDIGGVCAEEGR